VHVQSCKPNTRKLNYTPDFKQFRSVHFCRFVHSFISYFSVTSDKLFDVHISNVATVAGLALSSIQRHRILALVVRNFHRRKRRSKGLNSSWSALSWLSISSINYRLLISSADVRGLTYSTLDATLSSRRFVPRIRRSLFRPTLYRQLCYTFV